MSLNPVAFQAFGSLNLLDDPEEIGGTGATSLLNVDLDKTGRVRTRDGLAQYDTSGAGGIYTDIFADKTTASPQLMLCRNSGANLVLDKLVGAGTTITNVGSWTTNSGSKTPVLTSYASLGAPTFTVLFIASSSLAVTTLRRIVAGVLAVSVGSPAYVAATPWDNRLAQARFAAAADTPAGVNGSPSTVVFSNTGVPETFGVNDYIHLRPGDGEEITGIATFGDVMIVSKQTNLFVFTGVSVTGTGDPLFNVRRESIPARIGRVADGATNAAIPIFNALVAAEQGIYFVTSSGVFVTQGGPPVLISRDMTPIFDGTAPDDLAWDGLYPMSMYAVKDRVYLSYSNVNGDTRTLLYDIRRKFWTVWSFPNSPQSFAGFATSYVAPESLFVSTAAGHIYKFVDTQTSDAGTAIPAHWQSGIYELGPPGATAFTRWTRARGSGTPTLSVYSDHTTGPNPDPNAGTLTLGVDPLVGEGYHLKSYQGELFQHRLSSTTGAWMVSRLQHDVASVRP